jgi:hypothetical protein
LYFCDNVTLERLSSELDRLSHTIDNRLVLNLSSAQLTDTQLKLLKLGVGFRPTEELLLRDSEIIQSANVLVDRLAGAPYTTSDERTSKPSSLMPLQQPISSSSTEFGPGNRRKFDARIYRMSRKMAYDMRQECVGIPNIDVACGRHLDHFNGRLLVKVRNADGNDKRNPDPTYAIPLKQLKQLTGKWKIGRHSQG